MTVSRARPRAGFIVVSLGLVSGLVLMDQPAMAGPRPGVSARPGATQALGKWLDANASGRFAASMRVDAQAIVEREAWAPWPEVTAQGIVYRATATLSAPGDVCFLAAGTFAAQLGTELADHGIARPIEVDVTCPHGPVKGRWTPPGAGKPARLAMRSEESTIEGKLDYAITPTQPSGAEFEVGFLATTPFEENPQRILDYAGMTREDWFADQASKTPALNCWPSLWGGLSRQCVARLAPLQPRKCAAVALFAGYRDLQQQVDQGMSPRHSFELTAWCGNNRAQLRFTRSLRVEMEWFRDESATAELGTVIVRKKPVPLTVGGTQRTAFATSVDLRDKTHDDRFAEAVRRVGMVAGWLGAEGVADIGGLLDRVVKGLSCTENTTPGAVTPLSCKLGDPLPELTKSPVCRTLAFAAAYALPLASKGPLAGHRELEVTLNCDTKGRFVKAERELDFINMIETQPERHASDLAFSRDGTSDVWTAQFEALRDVR